MNTDNLILRLFILMLSVWSVVSLWIWGCKSNRKIEALSIILWLLNVITFHLYRMFIIQPDVLFLNKWSLGIHLQMVLTLAVAGTLLARKKP